MTRLKIEQCKHGLGVVACKPFYPGEEILKFSGALIHREDLPQFLLPENDFYLQIDEDLFLGPSGQADDFVNHSCQPNSKILIMGNYTVVLLALIHILPGESITFDYSTTMLNAPCQLKCSCNMSTCRGLLTDFSLLPDLLQEEYLKLGMIPEFIKKKRRKGMNIIQ